MELLGVVTQLLGHVRLFATQWTVAGQDPLSYTISCNLLNSCPLSRWCYLTISSSAAPFSFSLQSFPASGSSPISQLFMSGGQSIRASELVLGAPLKQWDAQNSLRSQFWMGMNKNRTRKSCSRSQMCTQTLSCVLVTVFSWNSLCSHQKEKRGWHREPHKSASMVPSSECT